MKVKPALWEGYREPCTCTLLHCTALSIAPRQVAHRSKGLSRLNREGSNAAMAAATSPHVNQLAAKPDISVVVRVGVAACGVQCQSVEAVSEGPPQHARYAQPGDTLSQAGLTLAGHVWEVGGRRVGLVLAPAVAAEAVCEACVRTARACAGAAVGVSRSAGGRAGLRVQGSVCTCCRAAGAHEMGVIAGAPASSPPTVPPTPRLFRGSE